MVSISLCGSISSTEIDMTGSSHFLEFLVCIFEVVARGAASVAEAFAF